MFMWLTEYQWALNYAKWMKGNKRVNREQRLAKKIPRRILHGALALPVTDRRERRGKKWADFDFQHQLKFGDNLGFLTRFLHIPFLTRNAIQYLKKHRGGNLWWTWRANHSNNHPIYQFLLLFPFFQIFHFFFFCKFRKCSHQVTLLVGWWHLSIISTESYLAWSNRI